MRLERLRLPQPFAGRQGDHRHELERTPLLRVEGGQDRRLQQKKKLDSCAEIAASAPEELTFQVGLVVGAGGAPVVMIVPTWCGAPEEGEARLAPFLQLGNYIGGLRSPTRAVRNNNRWAARGRRGCVSAGRLRDGGRLFRPLADQGDAHAQSNLGAMYANGRGVPQDDTRAVARPARWRVSSLRATAQT